MRHHNLNLPYLLHRAILVCIIPLALSCGDTTGEVPEKPNVILVLTDDQGYGDLSCHGNPVLKTPHLDQLYDESIRFTDFHVAPMCTPTRGELLTGMNAFRNGATAVCEGRSLPRKELPMMAQFFKNSGYSTGHFGKWHLGDNYPYRPQDRGFDETIHNQAWGIKSLAEHPENDAFGDCYWHNNALEQYEGYNTDVFFRQAMDWIGNVHEEGPFFAYIPTTAAHSPFRVDEMYSEPYDSLEGPVSRFFGMIANIDANMARLRAFLEEKELEENTILIFMSDNGTVLGHRIFNAGMRGNKTSEYDGGHRVPFFLRWPAGGYDRGRDIDALTHSTDLLPTLIDLCGLKQGRLTTSFDGYSLRPLLEGKEEALDERMVVVQYRALFVKWSGAVLWKKWRLVNGEELYDVASDPGQENNIAGKHDDVVRTMRKAYENWVAESQPVMDQTNFVTAGTDREPVTWLSACNWTGSYADNWENLADVEGHKFGHWYLDVATSGDYEVSLYLFHPALQNPLSQGYDGFDKVPARPVAKAQLLVDDNVQTLDTRSEETHATFRVSLNKGEQVKLEGRFLDSAGNPICGSFYTFVQKVDEGAALPTILEYVSPGTVHPM
jgi:arylsulfatase A-like enzyme